MQVNFSVDYTLTFPLTSASALRLFRVQRLAKDSMLDDFLSHTLIYRYRHYQRTEGMDFKFRLLIFTCLLCQVSIFLKNTFEFK